MKKIITLLLLLTLSSCSLIFPSRVLKRSGVFKSKGELKVLKSNNKEQKILFLGMRHIGRKEFYDDVAKKIDSLQKLGYVVFYENVKDTKEVSSLTTIKSVMKLRKLFGYSPEKHLDTTTNIIAGRIKYKGKYKLINQPKYSALKTDLLTATWSDVGLTELITEFEKKYSEIKLDSCDFKTHLRDREYKCKKAKRKLAKNFKNDFISDYRDKHLANKIIESKKNKILVVYGAAHYYGLWWRFYDLDKSISTKK